MDILGNKLIESYRTMIEVEDSTSVESPIQSGKVSAVQNEIVEHRNHCMLCKRNIMARSMTVLTTRTA
jgi:hypothetical protein